MDILVRQSLLIATVILVMSGLTVHAGETDQNGTEHAWSGPSDRYTVIDFAAAWCRPCWTVLPRLEAYAAEHPEVRVIVVSVDDEVKGRDALVEKLKLTIPVLWDGTFRIAEHYQPPGMPATFVLDPEGKVVYAHAGSAMKEWDKMVAFLDEVTGE
jgi:peroxiredoxin